MGEGSEVCPGPVQRFKRLTEVEKSLISKMHILKENVMKDDFYFYRPSAGLLIPLLYSIRESGFPSLLR